MFKVNNKDTRTTSLVSLLLTLIIFYFFFYCFYHWLWTGICLLVRDLFLPCFSRSLKWGAVTLCFFFVFCLICLNCPRDKLWERAEDHSFSVYAKFCRKLTSQPIIRTRTWAQYGVRNVSFSENFAFVLNKWACDSLRKPPQSVFSQRSRPANIYVFKVSSGNSRKRCEIFLELTRKTSKRRQSHLFLLFFILDFKLVNVCWPCI